MAALFAWPCRRRSPGRPQSAVGAMIEEGFFMLRSMTGYGRAQQTVDGYSILVEIKSVNHRFLEFTARVPRLYGYIEEKLKALVQTAVSRGKVDIFVTVDPVDGTDSDVMLNTRVAAGYIAALRELSSRFGLKDDITVSSVARFADIFTVSRPPEKEETVWNAVRPVAERALNGLVAMRQAEGRRLCGDIAARAQTIRALVEQAERRSPETVEEYRRRLTAHMQEILRDAAVDESRILTEAALYADKVSVTEETVRLKSHLKQMETMIAGGDAAGRRLDFLMQEMNREANTIGSKACDVEMAGIVVDIKAELEKIREQIQNIE